MAAAERLAQIVAQVESGLVQRDEELEVDPPHPAFSYTNQIWIGEDLVVRCNTGRLPGAFAHEAALLGTLEGTVPHAELLGHGEDEAGSRWSFVGFVASAGRVPGRASHPPGGRPWPKISRR